MDAEMLLEIENLGPINKANLDIKKINVIVGKNSTGKSTSSKFLFCLLTSLSKEGIYLANMDIKNRLNRLYYLLSLNFFEDETINSSDLNPIEELLNKPSSNDLFDDICHMLYDLSKKINSPPLKEMYLQQLKRVQELIRINKNRESQYVKIFNSLLDSEYAFSLKKDTHVTFKGVVGGQPIVNEILIKEHSRSGKVNTDLYKHLNFENIVYVDSLSILEFDNEKAIQSIEESNKFIDERYPYHIQQLNRKLKNTRNKGIYDDDYYNDLDVFKRKIDDMIGGNFKYDEENKRFMLEKDGEDYSMENTSSGLKQLGVIQLLLKNRELTENSFLILDEPEVHLHPGFQVQLAEILVLLAKDLNITTYINTHSPFLAEAIEVYSKYYKMYNQTNFYLTEKVKDKNKYDYILMDDEDIFEVYNTLGYPFETLNSIRFETELRDDLGG
ncbi:AAA family ATPase [uncultured Methanobrevibacter sp.]|uniref:AAA family ATPase n=1 Tax=uncultured Methanobrevibacter sp. TaxID=253161 RepID=UPI0026316A20|nr:AAA family ATPase [uncultured Methanobrevibacter sp.]